MVEISPDKVKMMIRLRPKFVCLAVLAACSLLAQGAFAAAKSHGPELDEVKIAPHAVVGGSPTAVTGTVKLEDAVPTGGVTITLGSSDTTVVTVPSSVTIAAGAKSADFAISTLQVSKESEIKITATLGTKHRCEELEVRPFEVKDFSFNPSTIKGGSIFTGFQPSVGTITINAPAGAAGVVVQLTSDTAGTSAKNSVTIPAGSTSVNFSLIANSVPKTTAVKFTAAIGHSHKSAILTITP